MTQAEIEQALKTLFNHNNLSWPYDPPALPPASNQIAVSGQFMAPATVFFSDIDPSYDKMKSSLIWDLYDADAYSSYPGFVAAGHYIYPGEKLITRIINGVKSFVKVTVLPNTRKFYYVNSATGKDTNTGTGTNTPFQSLAKALSVSSNSDAEIFLARGQKYLVNKSNVINAQNLRIGAYGSGTDPTLFWVGFGGGIFFSMDSKSDGLLIENIQFDTGITSHTNKIGVIAVKARGKHLTLRNCTALNIDSLVESECTGVLNLGFKAPLVTGIRAYGHYSDAPMQVLLGCSAANSTREHIFRSSSNKSVGITIHDCDFTNLDRRSVDPLDQVKNNITFRAGQELYVSKCNFHYGLVALEPTAYMHDANKDDGVRYVRMEDCTFDNSYLEVKPNAWYTKLQGLFFAGTISPPYIRITVKSAAVPNWEVKEVTVNEVDADSIVTGKEVTKIWGDKTFIVNQTNVTMNGKPSKPEYA